MFSARSLESNLGDTMRGEGIIDKNRCDVGEIKVENLGWHAVREIRLK